MTPKCETLECPTCGGKAHPVKGGWLCAGCRALFTDAVIRAAQEQMEEARRPKNKREG